MLTESGCRERRRLLWERLPACDLIIISEPRNLFYLSGFLMNPTELSGWGLNFLLLSRTGECRLLHDNKARSEAQAAFVDAREAWSWYDFGNSAPEKLGAAAGALAALLAARYNAMRQVAVEAGHFPAGASAGLAAAPVADAGAPLAAMRAVKFADELACIRRAIRATEAGHLCARTALQAGRSELEVYAEVQAAITRAAGEPIVLLGDFAAGQRTESGGGPPTANVLRTGDLMIFDIFPVIGGYRADITNTLCVGAPTHSQQQHMLALQAAMRAAEGELRPGATGAQVYAACRASLVAAGLGAAFFHHAGHGLGLGHPEAPFLVEHSTDTLQAGNVVTLEPGAYIKGWGGARIEHNYLITAGGFERLSQHQIGF